MSSQWLCSPLRVSRWVLAALSAALSAVLLLGPLPSGAQQAPAPSAPTGTTSLPPAPMESTQEWNQRLQELMETAVPAPFQATEDYRIGPDDLLDITVFEAPEMNREVRVSAGGEVTLALLGSVNASGLTPHELELVLQELLRRTYIKDPHVSVFVKEMQSHTVSVFGAVQQPGVFQIRGTKTLLEVLSMAQGLADDAGDAVIVMHGATTPLPSPASGSVTGATTASVPGTTKPEPAASTAASAPITGGPESGPAGEAGATAPPSGTPAPTASIAATSTVALTPPPDMAAALPARGSLEIDLKKLLESGDPQYNVSIYPGDIVKVTRAGIVYVVGDVEKPGGFVLKSNENISVLQAIALAEGLKNTAAKSQSRIIRTNEATGERAEIPMDLGKILAGKAPDPILQPKDIVFVPNSAARSALYRGAETALSIVSGVIIWRR